MNFQFDRTPFDARADRGLINARSRARARARVYPRILFFLRLVGLPIGLPLSRYRMKRDNRRVSPVPTRVIVLFSADVCESLASRVIAIFVAT